MCAKNRQVEFGRISLPTQVRLPDIDVDINRGISGAVKTRVKGRRRKLWEINSNMLCSVVGTCLTLDDLHKISRKLRLKFPAKIASYEIHGHFVQAAAENKAAGRMMHKRLERRHELAINKFARISDPKELEVAWKYAREKGNISGPYWAILSHPVASEELIVRIFGEVHMLSHSVAAANREELEEKNDLHRENFVLGEELNKSRGRLNLIEKSLQDTVNARAREATALDEKVIHTQIIEKELHQVKREIAKFKNGSEFVRAEREAEDLRKQLFDLKKRFEKAEGLSEIRKKTLLEMENAKDELLEFNQSIQARCLELEAAVSDSGKDRTSPDFNLSGRRIVYVGGRSGAMGHFKSVVEQANGIFIHHDGGLEDKIARLPDAIDQGDLVICPVDCVSHSACKVAKKHCKRKDCPFVLLRSSGLSTFVNALTEIARNPGQCPSVSGQRDAIN